MKTTFGLIVGLGLLVSGMSSVANAGGLYGCRQSKAVVVVTEPAIVYHGNSCSTYGYRYYTYPRYYSWRYGYSKARGWYGVGYRYYRYH